MTAADPTDDEARRLAELHEYDILDSVSEEAFDAITYLASQICDVPIALISIVDKDRQWFKSRVGLEASETHRDLAFCAHAIHDPLAMMVVPDATADDRFAGNPLVTDDPSIRFYAGAPLRTRTGNALGTLCVIDRKPRSLTPEQERALRALSLQVMALLDLRRTVAELEEKRRALEEATRQRDSLMAMVSHEIRMPLSVVIGYIELLRTSEDLEAPTRNEMLDVTARQAGDVLGLIEDLLVVSRGDTDSLKVDSIHVDLDRAVAQVLEGLDDEQRRLWEVRTSGASALGDPARVRQVVRNLVVNAHRYGGPRVEVATTTDGTTSHVLVSDDGDGVPVEDRDRIFEPFTRSERSREAVGSIGLGLSIARMLAERMGGSLTYRYEGGHSIFDLALSTA